MESFVVAVESRDQLPNLDQLVSKILEEERRQSVKGDVSDERLLWVKTSNGEFSRNRNNNNSNRFKQNKGDGRKSNGNFRGNNKSNNTNNSSVECYRCHQKGHIRSQCPQRPQSAATTTQTAASAFSAVNSNVSSDSWILDSGATSHMCPKKDMFEHIDSWKQKIVLASGDSVYSEGKGTIEINTETAKITLLNVLYVPDLECNFLSMSKVLKSGNLVMFSKDGAIVRNKNNEKLFEARENDDIFIVNFAKNLKVQHCKSACSENEWKKWHSRYGHLNSNDFNKLSDKNMVIGLNIKMPERIECVTCALCKIHSKPYKNYAQIKTKEPLEVIHSDLCGPFTTKSLGGSLYLITFIDDFSRFVSVYFLKQKSEAFEAFKTFAALAENMTGRSIKTVRTDNGKEYVNSKFTLYFKQRGIQHQTTVNYCPQQNGVAERVNRTLIEMARCLLQSSSLPQYLWAEAVNTAAYLRNRSPTRVLTDTTPFERWFGRKPSVFHLRVFGCDAIMLNKNRSSGKFYPKGSRCKLVGYETSTKGYRLYDPAKRQIIKARDVTFFEKSFDKLDKEQPLEESESFCVAIPYPDNTTDVINSVDVEEQFETASSESDTGSRREDQFGTEISESDAEYRKDSEIMKSEAEPARRQTRNRAKQQKLSLYTGNPQTVEEALQSEDAEDWKKAMDAEYNSLIKNKTWSLVSRPENKNIIGSRWVFTIKRKPDGSVEKFKARLVAQGCSQKYNVDYSETFAPVVRYSTIRLLLALAAKHQLLVNHVDIVSAYLNGNLIEEVYMRQPPGYDDVNNRDKVCKLEKALYGLKQAGREWNRKATEVLEIMGFSRCRSDSCVYVKRQGGNVSVIGLYVDDMIIATSSENEMKRTIEQLNEQVEADNRGPISFYLGMEIERDGLRDAIRIHQAKYTLELLKRWNMNECKLGSTPWPSGTNLQKCEGDCDGLAIKEYQSLIGGLMYLAIISRPDIAHAVSRLSQFNSHPHQNHFQTAKHVLRYLRGTSKGITSYSRNQDEFLIFTDSDWGFDPIDRKSYSGFAVFMAGGIVAWESKKQAIVALSTMEAEYVAANQGVKEIVFMRSLLREMGFEEYVATPTKILCDNQSALSMVKNAQVQSRSKHIDIKYHYIRDKFNDGSIEAEYVSSEENAADIFTKILSKEKHIKACNLLKLKFA